MTKKTTIFLITIIQIITINNLKAYEVCRGGTDYPAWDQICVYNADGNHRCGTDDHGIPNGCISIAYCNLGQYCTEAVLAVNPGPRAGQMACTKCEDITKDTPLILRQGSTKLEKIEFGQAVIDPNLIEY